MPSRRLRRRQSIQFDPTKQQIIIQGAPRTEAFAGGYDIYAKLGIRRPSGFEIGARIGYTQLFTGVLRSEASANGYVPIGVYMFIPLNRYSTVLDTSYSRQRNRAPVQLPAWFRSPTGS
ncbi:MAG: hypothetical protein FJ303_25480 [Planctomycetes bacterium]|nr:hypothetical protein [Planctomycetota bacterium]